MNQRNPKSCTVVPVKGGFYVVHLAPANKTKQVSLKKETVVYCCWWYRYLCLYLIFFSHLFCHIILSVRNLYCAISAKAVRMLCHFSVHTCACMSYTYQTWNLHTHYWTHSPVINKYLSYQIARKSKENKLFVRACVCVYYFPKRPDNPWWEEGWRLIVSGA